MKFKTFLGPKNLWSGRLFGSKQIMGPKQVKKYGLNNFWVEKNWVKPTAFFDQTSHEPNIFMNQNFFLEKNFLKKFLPKLMDPKVLDPEFF